MQAWLTSRWKRFERVNLTDAEIRGGNFLLHRLPRHSHERTVIRAAEMVDVAIDGDFENLLINGVDVAPYVEAELDRRDVDRAKMRPDDPAGFVEAWNINERHWAVTVSRASGLDADPLHQSVAAEWSFTETLRHLVFATDAAWVGRAILGGRWPH